MSNILLIEPDTILGHTYAAALEGAGHSVMQVSTAQAAVHASDAQQPDVVILELQLAVHDGVEFLHEFRSYLEWQKIPVIINTYLMPQVLELNKAVLATDFGVVACLYKPQATLVTLLQTVKKAITVGAAS